jgi:hypothetical protein
VDYSSTEHQSLERKTNFTADRVCRQRQSCDGAADGDLRGAWRGSSGADTRHPCGYTLRIPRRWNAHNINFNHTCNNTIWRPNRRRDTNPGDAASATLAHVPVGNMSITFNQRTKTAHTTLNMTGMPPNTSAVGLVVAGACDAPSGTLWQGANFSADPNDKVVNFKVKFSGVQGTINHRRITTTSRR